MNKGSTSTYIKLALIPLLGGVLCFLVFSQRSKSPPSPVTAVVAPVIPSSPEPKLASNPAVRTTTFKTEWPSFHIADVGNVDPFDRRTLFPVPAPLTPVAETDFLDSQTLVSTASAMATRRLELVKIQAVFQTPDGIAALVNDKIVHVGDRLDDGSEVIEIHPDHLSIAQPNIH